MTLKLDNVSKTSFIQSYVDNLVVLDKEPDLPWTKNDVHSVGWKIVRRTHEKIDMTKTCQGKNSPFPNAEPMC